MRHFPTAPFHPSSSASLAASHRQIVRAPVIASQRPSCPSRGLVSCWRDRCPEISLQLPSNSLRLGCALCLQTRQYYAPLASDSTPIYKSQVAEDARRGVRTSSSSSRSRSRRSARHVVLRTPQPEASRRPFPPPPAPTPTEDPETRDNQGDAPKPRGCSSTLETDRKATASPTSTEALPRMKFSYKDRLTASGNDTRDERSSQGGGMVGRGGGTGFSRQSGAAGPLSSNHQSRNSPPFNVPQSQPQQQQREQRQPPPLSTRQPPRPSTSVRRPRPDGGSLPGGALSNAHGVSALTADMFAEERVLAMLRADQRRANPGCVLSLPQLEEYSVPRATLKRCVLRLPIKGVAQEVLAIGQSTKAKLARTLCYMHAEMLLDFFASEETAEAGRASASPPPPLEEKKVNVTMAAPKERDFHSWDEYVDASEQYVQETATKARAEALGQQRVPASGHPVADRAAELLRRNRREYCRPTALSELNESLRDGSQLIHTAHLASQVFVATLKLDPKTGLTATGVAKNSKDARRECAAHALCILQLLQHDAEGKPQGSPLALPAGGAKGASQNGKAKRSCGANGEGTDADAEAARPGAALDAVLQQLKPSHGKLLRYFNLLFGNEELSPTTRFTRQTSASGSVEYHCELTMGDITCTGKGVNRFEAERSAMDDGVTELLLYDERLQAIQTFMDSNPSIAPESIPSAALPHALVEQLRRQLRPVAQHQLATRDMRGSATAAAAARKEESRSLNGEEQALQRLSERAFAADPLHSARMQDALLALRRHPTYLSKFHPRRSTLAMATVRQQVLDAVQNHRVTVVSGTTGCGKTTQVPQYILDHEIEQGRGSSCNILVTQPRRLSSFSVADRIASERLNNVGQDVGYAVRLDARPGRHITICTTGVLLQIFSTHPDLEHVSHLIIDEVHERDINCDVVLALVKGLLTRNPRLRVVLMSATMQSDVFAKYFGADTPVIEVEGAVYPVSVRYLEDVAMAAATERFYSPNFDVIPARKGDAQQHPVSPRAVLRKPPKTDYNLIAYLIHRAVQMDLENQTVGKSILVFLPGWKEMVAAKAAAEHYSGPFAASAHGVRFHFILLHSTVDSAKQRECFVPAPPGTVKVVLATNIAESGVTIDDAAVVIDTGLIKRTTWARRASASVSAAPSPPPSFFVSLDSMSATADAGSTTSAATAATTTAAPATVSPVFSTQLTLEYASQANGTQRKGRAGRTQGGVCYRLYTKGLWDALPTFPEADIHRVPLTQVLLKLLSLGYTRPKETMQNFLEPPSSTNVEVSMQLLSDIGAVDETEALTPLGEYLAKLPCDPRIGKMIIMGAVLRCLDSVLTVAACADVSPYVTSRDLAGAARKKRYLLARGSQSDHISFLNAFNAYCANKESESFAHFNLLHTGNLRIISKYKAQYRDILTHAGLISEQDELHGEGVVNSSGESAMDEDEEDVLLSVASDPTAAQKAPTALDAVPVPYHGELCVDTSPLSVNSFDVALVKACVCAALFPNVALLRPPPNTGSSLRRRRQAEKVEMRTKHFPSIKPSKESACRRVGGPRQSEIPDRTELIGELQRNGTGGASAVAPSKPVPALFYVYQDIFGVKEARQEFLTTLSSVSLWALLLFGASNSNARYNAELSVCVIDGWIAVQIDRETYQLIRELRQALDACLHGKYHHPRDEQNNAALRTVTEMCQTVLKAPVLPIRSLGESSAETENGEPPALTQLLRLVDTGSIVDPLALVRSTFHADSTSAANVLLDEGEDVDESSQESVVDDEEDEEEEFSV